MEKEIKSEVDNLSDIIDDLGKKLDLDGEKICILDECKWKKVDINHCVPENLPSSKIAQKRTFFQGNSLLLFEGYDRAWIINLTESKWYLNELELAKTSSLMADPAYPFCFTENDTLVGTGQTMDKYENFSCMEIITINKTKKPFRVNCDSREISNFPFRRFHTMEACDGVLYCFGGLDQDQQPTNNLIIYNTRKNSMVLPTIEGPLPSARYGHSSLWENGKMFIFGGKQIESESESEEVLFDLWSWDTKNHFWQKYSTDCTETAEPRYLSFLQGYGHTIFIFKGKQIDDVTCEDLLSIKATSDSATINDDLNDNLPFIGDPEAFFIYNGSLIIGRESEFYSLDLRLTKYKLGNEEEFSNIDYDMKKIFNEKLYPDIFFQVGDQEIPAHRAILAGRCSYFEKMFSSGMSESHKNKIEVQDIKYDVFKAALEYIYCKSTTLKKEIALDLLEVSEMYSLPELKKKCEDYLIASLEIDTAIDIVNKATKCEALKLRKAASDFISYNIDEISEKSDIAQINKSVLVDLIRIK